MSRELKAHTNHLEQLVNIFKNVFPNLITDLATLIDTRNQSYIKYNIQEITCIRLITLCYDIQSMKEIVSKLNKIQDLNLEHGFQIRFD